MSDNSNTQVLVAGALAAFAVDLLIYPLDTIKTRYQSRDFVKTYASSSTAKASTAAKVPVHVFRGLYQGVGGVIVATLPAAGIFFTTYESTKQLYTRVLADRAPQPLVHALASGTAELASCLVLTPAEVVKQNAQMLRQSSGSSGKDCARLKSTTLEALRMVRRSEAGGEGAVRRLWSGYTALAARNLPYTALQFPIFEFFRVEAWAWRDRRRRRQQQHNVETTIWSSESAPKASLAETGLVAGLSAAGAGAIAAVVTTPTDVVKTRMMLAAGQSDDSKEQGGDETKKPSKGPDKGRQQRRQRMSGFQVARLVFREKGVRGLFRGGALRAAWTALGSGIYLGSYEAAKTWLKDEEPGVDDLL